MQKKKGTIVIKISYGTHEHIFTHHEYMERARAYSFHCIFETANLTFFWKRIVPGTHTLSCQHELPVTDCYCALFTILCGRLSRVPILPMSPYNIPMISQGERGKEAYEF